MVEERDRANLNQISGADIIAKDVAPTTQTPPTTTNETTSATVATE